MGISMEVDVREASAMMHQFYLEQAKSKLASSGYVVFDSVLDLYKWVQAFLDKEGSDIEIDLSEVAK